ncbi:MAG: dihydroxy-acid dehydratase [Desulfobacula sp.]|jgi:dihydroxy-acid dehydratase|nr:dihydroxy-acid dehydratase [Desulfobacula sp.]
MTNPKIPAGSRRSARILKRPEYSMNRSIYKALGYSDDDLKRPIIGIANSWNTLVPGHANLRIVSDHVKQGIYRGGATAVEFGVIAACDGLAQGHEGMHYILPSREIICNEIELMIQAHQLDAMVLVGSCDKIIPGMLMAAARLDIPALLVPGGPMLGGAQFDGRKSDLTTNSEALGMLKAGKIDSNRFADLEDTCCPSCGSCSFLGTANTMGCLSEALGMTLPGGALIPATHPDRLRLAQETGVAVCRLFDHGITSRQIITPLSMENAVRTCLGISGSTNAVLHLTAIAYEADLDLDVIDLFDRFSRDTPQVARVNPSGPADMEAFWKAGGIPRVMDKLRPLLNCKERTSTGLSLAENLDGFRSKFPENTEIIKTMDTPFMAADGLAVLRGNLAPDSGISKPGAIDPSLWQFSGPARVFDSEEAAESAILDGQINPGDVVVIRYEGPKGGPGMREMYKAMKYLYGMGLAQNTALITDGRFSGTNNGCFVGHISPEAADGGPIAAVRDNDIIRIDIKQRSIHLELSDLEIKQRLGTWLCPKPKIKKGYLALYARLAGSAAQGAVIRY